jgi:hypothetical protein
MTMTSFQHLMLPDLPPLGWLFEFTQNGGGKLYCGTSVRVDDSGFFEGCWAAHEGNDPSQMTHIYGSGMIIKNEKPIFLNPSHTLEALFLYRHAKGWTFSNSLSFLVAYHNLQMPWDPTYGAKFVSICRGIDAYEKNLFQTAGGEVLRLAYDNVEMQADGNFRLIRKPMPPAFPNFKVYSEFLEKTLKLAFEDAKAKGGYDTISTCSSGYDSACATALAAKFGCREAITLKNARGGDDDSGTAIADALGLRTHEFQRPEIVENGFDEAADFLATGMGGEDYCYRNFAPVLKKRVVLSGFHGDKSWEVGSKPDTVLGRADLCGCSLAEFRLWQDFIHLPVPTIGTRRHPEVVALATTPEMAPWRLHNHYDRPVPRRIVEEAGVARHLFGQSKKAASILLFYEARLFPPAIRRECEAAVPAEWTRASKYSAARFSWDFRHFLYRTLGFIQYNVPLGARIPGIANFRKNLVGEWRIFEHSHPRAVLEFMSAVQVVGRRYRKALAARASKPAPAHANV